MRGMQILLHYTSFFMIRIPDMEILRRIRRILHRKKVIVAHFPDILCNNDSLFI